jgi:hypothetical protein
VACDGNGFRNARDLSTAEVVVLGDSFVEGGLVAASDLMTATLSRLLGCTVANLGQSAYGPQQELAVLKRFGTGLHPRLCIWAFYGGNDLDDVERYEQLRQDRVATADRSTAWERSFGHNALLVLAERLVPSPTSLPTRQTGRRGAPSGMTTAVRPGFSSLAQGHSFPAVGSPR